MRPISKEKMMTHLIDIDKIIGKKTDQKNTSERTSSHAIFLFDDFDKERKKRIDGLINNISNDGIKISKMGCSAVVDSSEIE